MFDLQKIVFVSVFLFWVFLFLFLFFFVCFFLVSISIFLQISVLVYVVSHVSRNFFEMADKGNVASAKSVVVKTDRNAKQWRCHEWYKARRMLSLRLGVVRFADVMT